MMEEMFEKDCIHCGDTFESDSDGTDFANLVLCPECLEAGWDTEDPEIFAIALAIGIQLGSVGSLEQVHDYAYTNNEYTVVERQHEQYVIAAMAKDEAARVCEEYVPEFLQFYFDEDHYADDIESEMTLGDFAECVYFEGQEYYVYTCEQ